MLITIMQSVTELQKRVELLTDQIHDIFHATNLNLQALNVQLQSYNQSKITLGTLTHCRKECQNIQNLFNERGSLRLEYLITEQIKQQQAKVRRERLVEYQQKIYDQRRLISDKQAFYEGLLKPRRKRPPHMTIQQFQGMRRQQITMQERKNLKRVEEQANELKMIEKMLKADNAQLQKMLHLIEKQELSAQEVGILQHAIEKNPILYESFANFPYKKQQKQEIKKLYQTIVEIQKSNNEIHKQYLQEKELNQYLRWQHSKLKAEYQKKGVQRSEVQMKHRKRIQLVTKYRIKRSCSI